MADMVFVTKALNQRLQNTYTAYDIIPFLSGKIKQEFKKTGIDVPEKENMFGLWMRIKTPMPARDVVIIINTLRAFASFFFFFEEAVNQGHTNFFYN